MFALYVLKISVQCIGYKCNHAESLNVSVYSIIPKNLKMSFWIMSNDAHTDIGSRIEFEWKCR